MLLTRRRSIGRASLYLDQMPLRKLQGNFSQPLRKNRHAAAGDRPHVSRRTRVVYAKQELFQLMIRIWIERGADILPPPDFHRWSRSCSWSLEGRDVMSCTRHILNLHWPRHSWHRRVSSTESITTQGTDMWGRRFDSEGVRCNTEHVCDACGAIRAGWDCVCDMQRAERCAVRLQATSLAGRC